MNKLNIKTMVNWVSPYFEKDFAPGDRVGADIYEHFLNCLPPYKSTSNYLQLPSEDDYICGKGAVYMTFINDGISWIYAGTCLRGESNHLENNY